MGTGRTDEFHKDAVRIALTSELSRRQVADDLGRGFSTLNTWVSAHRNMDVISAGHTNNASLAHSILNQRHPNLRTVTLHLCLGLF